MRALKVTFANWGHLLRKQADAAFERSGQRLGSKRVIWDEPQILKTGLPSRHRFNTEMADYTALVKCQLCGFLSTPKKVQYRPWTTYHGQRSPHWLCMSCWNRTRAIREADKLLRDLERELQTPRKGNQQSVQAATS